MKRKGVLTSAGFIYIILTSCIFCSFISCNSYNRKPPQSAFHQQMAAMVERWFPGRSAEFIFEKTDANPEQDYFCIDSFNGKIRIRSNNGIGAASGFNWYIKNYCNTSISINFNSPGLPDQIPLPQKQIKKGTPFEYRNFFNYCTFGYTMAWWDWKRWEKLIDWMAMNGINMPLAITGQEAVWQKLLLEHGLVQSEIDAFLVGPAFLPWGWMGNIDGMAGPLPQTWVDNQKKLQKKILERERSFGMKPVLQAFTGHIPKAVIDKNPELKYIKTTDWAGMPGTYFLNPNDPLFAKLGRRFIEIQTDLYGSDHLYDADCFNEVNPPTNDTVFIGEVSRKVFESMTQADPDAVWVMQGWFLFWQQNFWKEPQARALLDPIPNEKLILLDLYGEKYPVWNKTKAFYGKKWVWNIICNLGQQVNLSGDLKQMNKNLQDAMTNPEAGKLAGIGVMMEGFGYNPVVQEFIGHKIWEPEYTEMDNWIREYAFRRYGTQNQIAADAWSGLLASVYDRTAVNESPLCNPPGSGIPSITDSGLYGVDYDTEKLIKAGIALLSLSDSLKAVASWRFDITHIFREILTLKANRMLSNAYTALENQNLNDFRESKKKFLTLLQDLDQLLGSQEMFLLGKWIADAREKGNSKEEKDFYELNARSIITLWQPDSGSLLRDYASKQWNGMIGDFYYHRWLRFFDEGEQAIKSRKQLNYKKLNQELRQWEFEWINATSKYPSKAKPADLIKTCNRIVSEYL